MHYRHKDVPRKFSDPKPEKKENKPKSGLKRKIKPTGEKIVFQAISDSRQHTSFVSGQYLGVEMPVSCFAHVLPKAKNKYPEFKLNPKNIILLTPAQHREWDFGLRSTLKLLPEWDKMFRLEEELKGQYKKLKN